MRKYLSPEVRLSGRWFAAIVSLLLCLYVVSYSGIFRADDEHILASRAVSLALRGEWEEPQVFGNLRVQSLIALGDPATQIEPAQTVFGAALVSLARFASLGKAQALFSLNVYLTALTAGIVFLVVLALRYDRKTAAWCALFFGVATMAWPYATTFYRDVSAMFFASLAFLGWAIAFKGDQKQRLQGAALMAFGLVGGILAKNTAAALIPAFAMYGIIRWFRSEMPAITRLGLLFGATFISVAVVLIIAAAFPSTGPLSRFSYAYYIGLLDHFLESIGPELVPAFLGPFFSPAKSLLLFSPVLLLAILGIRPGMRTHPWFVVPALSFALWIALAQGLFYREQWAGAAGWGLRYMLPALPPLMIVAAPAVADAIRSRRNVVRIGLYALLISGVLIQLAGVLVNWNLVYRSWQARGFNPFSPAAAWDPQYFSVPGQIMNMFRPSTWTVAWYRTLLGGAAEAIVGPAVAVAIACLIVVVWRRSGVGSRLDRGLPRMLALFLALAVALPSLPLWWAYRRDPYWGGNRPEFAEATEWISPRVLSGDVFLIGSYGTPLWSFWLNWWNQEVPWYSLAFEIPSPEDTNELPSGLTVALVDSIEGNYSRLWYVSSSDNPGHGLGTETRWLDERYPPGVQQMFDGDAVDVVAGLYDLPLAGD